MVRFVLLEVATLICCTAPAAAQIVRREDDGKTFISSFAASSIAETSGPKLRHAENTVVSAQMSLVEMSTTTIGMSNVQHMTGLKKEVAEHRNSDLAFDSGKEDLRLQSPASIAAKMPQTSEQFLNANPILGSKLGALKSPKPQRCAVCFIGQLRSVDETSEGIRTSLLEPIASDFFVDVYVAAEQGGPCNVTNFGLPFGGDNRISLRNYTWGPHKTMEELYKDLASKAPEEALNFYKHHPGNWLGFRLGGNGLRIYHHERDCIDMIKHREQESSMQYTWVVKTRPDFVWMVPHPPLSLMSLNRMWKFEGLRDYGGINPRHLFGSRDVMFKILDRLHLLEVGDHIVYKMPQNHWHANEELYTKLIAEKHHIKLGTISYIAHLSRNPRWVSTGWRGPGAISSDAGAAANATTKWNHGGCWQRVDDSKVEIVDCGRNIKTRSSVDHV